jgi:hypothetical protein
MLFEAAPEINTLFIRCSAVYHPDAKAILAEMTIKVIERVSEATKQHYLVVGQLLLVPDGGP